jgi:putative ABC transport system ATP-binding protein
MSRSPEQAWKLTVEEVTANHFRARAVHPDGRAIERSGTDEEKLRRDIQEDMAQLDSAHTSLEPLLEPIDNGPIIRVRDLMKTYRVGEVDVHALNGVSLSVTRGEFLSIVGTSGSGKSTLFNILGGLTPPTSGTVEINGRDLSNMSNHERDDLRKRTVGFVFQKYNLLPTLTAEQNIQIVRHVAGRPLKFDDHFNEVLNMLGIAHRMHHKPRALSGGEQQRVAIARAIVNGPAILLADEPTGNLDSKNSDVVLNLLRDLNRRLGQTILMITHNPEAAAYADRIIQMRDGKVIGEL